jgi:hypothetical protein
VRGREGAHRLENAEGADEVGLDVAFGIVDGVAHACLGREVDDRVGAVFVHQVVDDAGRFDAFRHGAEAVGLQEARLAAFLEGDVIVVAEAVDADHLPPIGQQAGG